MKTLVTLKPVVAKLRKQQIKLTIRVITPLFGGGVAINEAAPHQKEPDSITLLRGSAIRGQLRFFWRATCGARMANRDQMRKEEARIFGAASEPGALALRIEDVQLNSQPVSPPKAVEYATFPLRPDQDHRGMQVGSLTKVGGTARLVLSFPKDMTEHVGLALDAWLLFGGVGGRTRRFARSRRESGQTPGRSYWPEADALRFTVTGVFAKKHRERLILVDKFPRGMFGMPIIFHFKDEKLGDPKDHTLNPKGNERMASPVIIRPYALKDGYGCLALVLQDQNRQELPLALTDKSKRISAVTGELTQAEAQAIGPLAGERDPLSAFLQFFAKESK
jgi:CRISPR-associated protein Cmr1